MERIGNSILDQMGEENPSEKVNRLIDSLLASSFVVQHQLSDLSIEELGERLFEVKDDANGEELQKSIHDYCLLLQELESQEFKDFGAQTLAELRQRETKTRFISPFVTTEPTEQPLSEVPLDFPTDIPVELSPDLSAIESDELGWDRTAEDGEKIEPTKPSASDWMQDEGATEHGISLFNAQSVDSLGGLENEQIKIGTEGITPALEPQSESDTPQVESSISRWIEVPEPSTQTADEGNELANLTQEYWTAGEQALTQEALDTLRIGIETQLKLSSLCFCLAVEKELHQRTYEKLVAQWGERTLPIVASLDTQNRRFDLQPSLKALLETAAAEHGHWLYEGKLPSSGIINSLRYTLATEESDKFRPSLLDWGVVYWWFGKETERGNVKFSNLLGIETIAEGELTELAFRLFRLNKYKMKALSVSQAFEASYLDIVREDAVRVLEILKGISFSNAWLENQVA